MNKKRTTDDKCKMLDYSNKLLKGIVKRCNNRKLENLDLWINFQAKTFSRENSLASAPRFKRYRRGTIVMVDFGTGIGNELSGYHFGIVLTKHDSPGSGTVTVLPLTSKNKKYNIPLGTELVQKAFDEINAEITQLQDILDSLLNKLAEISKSESIENTPKILTLDDEPAVRFLNKFTGKEAGPDQCINYTGDEIIQMLYEIKNELSDAYNFYHSKMTDSFGIITGISTVSKFRIRKPINRMDPIGSIRVSDTTLQIIDMALVKTFTGLTS
ncbi:type II toxin-antitoxin system PemK/MazF family toxin [Faecalibaculum rodentium]|uniref:type II toxin-antitoxin system PemK/MazF family toxin n=1 Tax=Faecalibaculum rodentium TaxID=1702221 RepID=UPI00255ACF80|nr:type II toxin-antitoxin system PemK/MazF family toxin [Faecalibaculum rodentium]